MKFKDECKTPKDDVMTTKKADIATKSNKKLNNQTKGDKEMSTENKFNKNTDRKFATKQQYALLSKAVRDGRIERFDSDAWRTMTYDEAEGYIAKVYTDGIPQTPATDAQKSMLKAALENNFIKGYDEDLTFEDAQNILNNLPDKFMDLYNERKEKNMAKPVTQRQIATIQNLQRQNKLQFIAYSTLKSLMCCQASDIIEAGIRGLSCDLNAILEKYKPLNPAYAAPTAMAAEPAAKFEDEVGEIPF